MEDLLQLYTPEDDPDRIKLPVSLNGASLLHWAASMGSLKSIEFIFQKGIISDANIKDDEGATPLHHASGEGRVSCSEYLLDKSANPNATDIYGIQSMKYN